MNRAPGLDLLRAAAIVWVMYYHAQIMDLVPDSDQVARFGWMGVDLFFALSGYLIGSQLFRPLAQGRTIDAGRFYVRRALRTLPAYFVVVAIYFTVPAFRERPAIQPLWQFLTFTENLFIDFQGGKAFSHVWSLCVEEQFYLVVPVAAWWLARRPKAWKVVALCAAILLAGMALRGFVWLHDLAPIRSVTDGPGNFWQRYQERIYYPTWNRLDGLLGGVVLALIAAFRPSLWVTLMHRANLIGAAALVCLGIAIWIFTDQASLTATVIGFPLLSLGMTGLVAWGAGPHGLLGRRAVPGAGAVAAMAYSLYLTHKQIYHMVRFALGEGWDDRPILAFGVCSLAAFAGGALLYWTIERPFLLLRDRIRKKGAHVPPFATKGLADDIAREPFF
jgi:peptidoglycan/LPS O-acetylase OafA/YrhL